MTAKSDPIMQEHIHLIQYNNINNNYVGHRIQD